MERALRKIFQFVGTYKGVMIYISILTRMFNDK